MKIAIDIREAAGEKTGKGWYTFNLVKNLIELDRQKQYVLYTKNAVPGLENYKNVTQKVINSRGIFWHRKVAKDAQKENVDIFFAPTSYITPIFLPKSIKVVMAVHDLVAFLFPSNHNKKAVFIEKTFFKKALKRADFICAVSKNTKEDIVKNFDYDPKKIETIYCSASDSFRTTEKEELEVFSKKTNLPKDFFLAVGTLEPRKNHIATIEALAQIHKKHPNTHLIVIGKEGWEFKEIYEEIGKNYLKKYVHFLGYISESGLIKLYNLAHALVFPSYYEGFGIPPLEAMKCGCPVIASFTSSIPEVVGDAGILIDPEKPEQIAGAMEKILTDKSFRRNLKGAGFLQAKKFSWETSARRLLDVFEGL